MRGRRVWAALTTGRASAGGWARGGRGGLGPLGPGRAERGAGGTGPEREAGVGAGAGAGARSPPDGGPGRGCQLGAWRGLHMFPRESVMPVRPPPLPAASPPVFGAAGTVRRSRSSFVFVSLSPSSYWKLESDGGENKPLA